MTTRYRSLPLFPLNTVLFPNAQLPLQIFEERYKRMLSDIMDSDSMFGVALIREGQEVGGSATTRDVGTVARVTQVERIDSDRFFVASVGVRPFRTLNIISSRPYMVAEVELIYDSGPELEPDDPLVEDAIDTFSDYARAAAGVAGGWVRRARVPSDPAALSYHIANSLQMDLADKQRLLEIESTEERLTAEIDILKRNYSAIRRRMAIEMMSKFSRH